MHKINETKPADAFDIQGFGKIRKKKEEFDIPHEMKNGRIEGEKKKTVDRCFLSGAAQSKFEIEANGINFI